MANVNFNLETYISDHWLANHSVMWLCGDEPHEYMSSVQAAVDSLRSGRKQNVDLWFHDKVNGFFQGLPDTVMPTDKTNGALLGLQCALSSRNQIAKINPDLAPKFINQIERDMIFVFKDIDVEMNANPLVVQMVRNLVQSNMQNPDYTMKKNEGPRGKRMIIILTAEDKFKVAIPELQPTVVPLPQPEMLKRAIHNVWDIHAERYTGNKSKGIKADPANGLPPMTKEQEDIIAAALLGFTFQRAEDTMSLILATKAGITKGEGITDMKALLRVIKTEKATYVSNIPGLTFIDTEELTATILPGYEPLFEAAGEAMKITPEDAVKYKIKRFRGAAIAGPPGTGKSDTVTMLAAFMNKMLLLWSLGETQNSLVGESEKNTRRAMQIAEALGAMLLIDDIDKAGANTSINGRGSSDVFTRMIQMLLTQMSDKDSKATYIFTFNRTKGVPPELIRPGRIDYRAYVQRPDELTRKDIFKVRLAYHKMIFDLKEQEALDVLATEEVTGNWSGAEIADLCEQAARRARLRDSEKMDTAWMVEKAKATKPMATMPVYAADIREMEKDCEQFTKIGQRTTPLKLESAKDKTTTRTGRSVKV